MSIESNLFTIEDLPAKIFLEGFTYLGVLRATKLIITHGGSITPEPDDTTIILSPPSGHSSPKYARFSVNWLHDCISESKFLDIMQYILPPWQPNDIDNAASSMEPSTSHCTQSSTEYVQSMEKEKNTNERMSLKTEVTSTPSTSFSLPKTTKASELKRSRSDTPKASGKRASKMNDVVDLTIDAESEVTSTSMAEPKYSIVISDSDESDSSELRNIKLDRYAMPSSTTSDGVTASTSRDADLLEFDATTDTEPQQKKMKSSPVATPTAMKHSSYLPYNSDEHQKMVDYLITNNVIHLARDKATWRNAIDEGLFTDPYRTAGALHTHFLAHIRHHYKNYTDDPVARLEFKKVKGSYKEEKRSRRAAYSEEDESRIVKFIIKNHATRRLSNRDIWVQMEDIFDNPPRKADSLKMYFEKRMGETFRNYTKDVKALQELESHFSELANRKKSKAPPYTEEEQQEMVQYLINNSAISQAFGKTIWEKMEADKILVKPHRTADQLADYFQQYLQYHFADYTKDPEAVKEFERLQKSRE